jgi:hypothetical protein
MSNTEPTELDELGEISEILEEWLDEAMATSSLGVTIDDTRTEDDRNRQYSEALEKNCRQILALINKSYISRKAVEEVFEEEEIELKAQKPGDEVTFLHNQHAIGYNQAIDDIKKRLLEL